MSCHWPTANDTSEWVGKDHYVKPFPVFWDVWKQVKGLVVLPRFLLFFLHYKEQFLGLSEIISEADLTLLDHKHTLESVSFYSLLSKYGLSDYYL